MVARDGIEPPTQAFSGLCSRDSSYVAPAKSSFLISERSENHSECGDSESKNSVVCWTQ